MVVVVGLCVRKREAGGRAGAKTPMAWFWAAFEKQGANGVLWDCSPPPPSPLSWQPTLWGLGVR
jgi:hypothetical protein